MSGFPLSFVSWDSIDLQVVYRSYKTKGRESISRTRRLENPYVHFGTLNLMYLDEAIE